MARKVPISLSLFIPFSSPSDLTLKIILLHIQYPAAIIVEKFHVASSVQTNRRRMVRARTFPGVFPGVFTLGFDFMALVKKYSFHSLPVLSRTQTNPSGSISDFLTCQVVQNGFAIGNVAPNLQIKVSDASLSAKSSQPCRSSSGNDTTSCLIRSFAYYA